MGKYETSSSFQPLMKFANSRLKEKKLHFQKNTGRFKLSCNYSCRKHYYTYGIKADCTLVFTTTLISRFCACFNLLKQSFVCSAFQRSAKLFGAIALREGLKGGCSISLKGDIV
ncbi:hypothetical protein CEXT_603101 [Caerostris extrusa]|uniref:Uncharacterized protein n=1 Tax=Caerostris extrusa TaxID=172846 RepID=A0AAV4NJ01_CAEEX|nr:hypothetical protein CEXT_603101 [Caerostris extrusa]